MRRIAGSGRWRLLAVMAVLAAGLLAVSLSIGSSHREAPNTMLDPTADDTDFYSFVAKDSPSKVTFVANWIPFEDPAGGPNFYRFDDKARYYINIDNTGDGKYDIRYRFTFRTQYRNPNSFLYALPGVTSISDPKLQQVQRYKIERLLYRNGRLVSRKLVRDGIPVAPNNVGPKTIPNYNAVANGAIKTIPGNGRVFAGQREDPFFVDLGAAFDGINLRSGTGNQGGGKDDLAGYGVHSVVLQVPKSALTRDRRNVSGPTASNAVIGSWASTERQPLQVTNGSGSGRGAWTQVSRLGNPLINELVIPVGQKDRFNRTQPDRDAARFGKYVVEPELAKIINILFPGLNVPETDRTDIVQALLTGIPDVTQISPNPAAADTLKLNMGVPPAATENRFGVIAGDNAGFPNGRRLADDVVDIELRVVGGFLKGNKLPLGDGVNVNDKPFLSQFPYVGPPDSGFDSELKQDQPASSPTPAQP